jgi:hypothetical protein
MASLINLQKSRFLLPLLQSLLSQLLELGTKKDTKLNNQLYLLHHIISDPSSVKEDELKNILLQLKSLLSGYDNIPSSIPEMMMSAMEEIDHLSLSNKILSVQSDINSFLFLSSRG